MKIVGSTSSEDECNEIEQIIKTFLIGQRARTLAYTTNQHLQKKHHNHILSPHTLNIPHPTLPMHHFTVKGLN
ncbi:MAG: hypothetical protein KKG04_08165 [Candidatus Thermoplasmatota archaeon]|nr:hypothetical protein [Candidatus Thermoplasmatota archaeon]